MLNVIRECKRTDLGVKINAYISPDKHLLSQIFTVSFIAMCRTILSPRKYVLKVRFQKSLVAQICQFCIWICGNLVVDVKVGSLVLVEEQSAEGCTISNVDNFGHLFRQRDIEQVSYSGEGDVFELLLDGHLAESLPVSPCILIGYA